MFGFYDGPMDLRALVVCPDQDAANLLQLILTELGMAVENTPSNARGAELLDSRRFDAIVFDYRADQSSEEFLAHFRQSTKNRGSVLIAIVDSGFNARPVFGLGANFVLYRPLSLERTRVSLRAARGLVRRERRRGSRMSLSSTVNVSYPGAPETCGVLADLGDGGTLIHTASRIPPECKVYFEFALPGQQELVRLSGEVAWQDASGRTGIRFLDVPQSSRNLMQAWMQQNGSQPLAEATPGGAAAEKKSEAPASEEIEQSAFVVRNPIPTPDPVPTPAPRPVHSEPCPVLTPAAIASAGNRRGEQRMACALGAEVYRLGSSVPNRCSLSDISEGGCYVEMPSPLSGQPGVEILVRTADTKLKVRGQVITSHPGFGMGVRFLLRDSGEREKILQLLAILSAGPSLDEQRR
jgi:CheY-like chemotaxis protein